MYIYTCMNTNPIQHTVTEQCIYIYIDTYVEHTNNSTYYDGVEYVCMYVYSYIYETQEKSNIL